MYWGELKNLKNRHDTLLPINDEYERLFMSINSKHKECKCKQKTKHKTKVKTN